MAKLVHEHVIHTGFVYPPIPIRKFDWQATLDGYEPGDVMGEGETEIEAVRDLLERLTEQDQESGPGPVAEYPEHEKLRLVRGRGQVCDDFLQWLNARSIGLFDRSDKGHLRECGLSEIKLLISVFVGIDLHAFERELQQRLEGQKGRERA